MADNENVQQCDHLKAGLEKIGENKYRCKKCGAVLIYDQAIKQFVEDKTQEQKKIETSEIRKIREPALILEDILKEVRKCKTYLYYILKKQGGKKWRAYQ